MAQKFVENNYYRIDLDARQVMDAVAVFARPVTAAALDYVLEPFAPNVNIPDVVNRLLDSRILAVDRTTKTVTMHPIDKDYAYSQLPETGKYNRTQLELSAATWYRSRQKEGHDWKSIQELEPNILEFEHLLRADAYDKAMEALSVFSAHLTWIGHAGRAREMIAQLDGKLQDERALMLYYYAKGDNMVLFGDFDKSRPYLADALALASKFDDLGVESNIVSLMGAAEKGVGNVEAAVEHYLRALKLFQASGNSLAWTLYRMGKPEEALGVIEKERALSGELRALEAIKSLSGAIETLKGGDLSGEARYLLDCARICQDDIDLWDASDIASRALTLAQAAEHDDLKMQAQILINDLKTRLVPPE